MVVGQIHSGFGNQRHQAGNEIQWFEHHMCGAVEADFKSSGNPAGNLQLAEFIIRLAPYRDRLAEIHDRLCHFQDSGKSLFASSSFQTHSIPLLHILSKFNSGIPVYFLDTGFHFPETRIFRDRISDMLHLNLITINSPVPKIAQRDEHTAFLFTSDPDRCCYLNKVLPMEPILMKHDVWISGVRREQTHHRKGLNIEEQGIHDTLRYHPLLNWTAKMVWEYRKAYNLPEHPLEAKGYLSIGCVPCTRKFHEHPGKRGGRWAGMSKEECGIHTEFAQK